MIVMFYTLVGAIERSYEHNLHQDNRPPPESVTEASYS